MYRRKLCLLVYLPHAQTEIEDILSLFPDEKKITYL